MLERGVTRAAQGKVEQDQHSENRRMRVRVSQQRACKLDSEFGFF